ncbi:MMPL family transporter [Actinocorallia longicatena]|uniref:Trehalose monomycolate RND transporter MmpL3 n=1 Tax=Actinocorallia longicatena TaxID=111803 RepID=A0ABP6QMV0_9ACTN
MYGWGRFVHRFRWLVLLVSVVSALGSGLWGLGVMAPTVLKQGGFEDPHSDSTFVYETAVADFQAANPHVVLVYRSATLQVTDPEFERSVLFTVARLPKQHVKSITSYWHIPGDTQEMKDARRSLVSHTDGKSTFVALVLQGQTDAELLDHYNAIKDRFAAPGMSVQVGGAIPIGQDFTTQMAEDLHKAELITLPLVVIIGILVFGSVTAALMPLFVTIFSIMGALAVLRGITLFTDVSTFALQLVTMLAAGLAIDYSLFIINRFREELNKGRDPRTAMGVTMATAGRTVAFSAVTVAASMAGLLLFPQMFLRSIGLGGIAVIIVALFSALVLLPAMLSILGHRIEFLRMPWRRKIGQGRRKEDSGGWYRLAHSVMKRPVLYFVGVAAVLAVLVAPFGHVQFGSADIRSLPEKMPTRQVVETIQKDFSGGVLDPIDIMLEGDIIPKGYKPGKDDLPPNLLKFRKSVADLENVTAAQYLGWNQNSGVVRMQVTYKGEAVDDSTRTLVREIRALTPPEGVRYLVVGGSTAIQMDLMTSLTETLPRTAIFVAVAIFILLFAAFGSIALPIKAILMNLLSIGSSFGAIVWAFQDGHMAEILNFTPTGTVDASSMILVLAVVFGLSMDYEVFLLSRVKEEWDKTHDNRAAVAMGLQRTGGIITSAAVLLIVVVGAFSTAEITVVKLFGVGILVAVVVDATLVRSLLVPATMRFLGDANWWLPKPLRLLHAAIDMGEVHDIDVEDDGRPAGDPDRRHPSNDPASHPSHHRSGPPAPYRRSVTPVRGGYAWSAGRERVFPGQSVNKREIVANPDGPGWRWREDEYAR